MRLARTRPRRRRDVAPAAAPAAAVWFAEEPPYAPEPRFFLGLPPVSPAPGAETYLSGDSNTDGSVRLLTVADANGDGVADLRLQWRVGGAWADVTTLNVVPASAVILDSSQSVQALADNLVTGGVGSIAATNVTTSALPPATTVAAALGLLQSELDAAAVTTSGKVSSLALGTVGNPPALDAGLKVPAANVPALETFAPALAKGDILVFDGSAYRRQPAGANGSVLLYDSTSALGLGPATISAAQVSAAFVPTSYSPTAPTDLGHLTGMDIALGSILSRVAALEAGTPSTTFVLLANATDSLLLVDGSSKLLL